LSRESRDPFALMQSEMHRLFDHFFDGSELAPFDRTAGGMANMPKVDVAETEDAVHVTAELPGLSQADVDVTLSNGNLLIRGEKKAEHEEKQKNYHRIERSYGSFHRSIPLPAEVDRDKVEASFKDGVLNVVLPKAAAAVGKKISVRTGS